eukprot:Clim_evm206s157 gene=Clim_evmTU206s157
MSSATLANRGSTQKINAGGRPSNSSKDSAAARMKSTGSKGSLRSLFSNEKGCCEVDGCSTTFGMMRVRNECSRCNGAFCAAHCSGQMRLKDGHPSPDGSKQKVCINCMNEVFHNVSEAGYSESRTALEKKLKRRSGVQELLARNVLHGATFCADPCKSSPPQVVPDAVAEPTAENAASIQKADAAERRKRRESLSLKLAQRPQENELRDRGIVPAQTPEQKQLQTATIVKRLSAHISQRPDLDRLKDQHIIREGESPAHQQEIDAKQRRRISANLDHKLKRRPTVTELAERNIIKFNEYVDVIHTHDPYEYDRRCEKTWTRLTNKDKVAIKKELNEFKRTMPVHEDSVQNTRFHY